MRKMRVAAEKKVRKMHGLRLCKVSKNLETLAVRTLITRLSAMPILKWRSAINKCIDTSKLYIPTKSSCNWLGTHFNLSNSNFRPIKVSLFNIFIWET